MSEPSLSLQKALRDRLHGATDAGAHVYDGSWSGDPFPRITLGDAQVLPDDSDCTVGFEVYADIHVWSRGTGSVEAKTIGSQAHGLLHEHALVVPGYHLVECVVTDTRYMRDPDGKTTHGVLTLRVTLDRDD